MLNPGKKPALIVVGSAGVSVLSGDGTTFQTVATYTAGAAPSAVVAADLEGKTPPLWPIPA